MMKRLNRLSLKVLLTALIGSVLIEGLIVSMVLSANIGTVYIALAGLLGIALFFTGCAIHLAIRIARMKLW